MSVTLTFLGAAREVTGSCILVQTARNRFLVDCGMFQGGGESDRKNARRMPVPPASVDFVLSTHAHIDHSGLLPKLVRDGFRGPIHCTSATADLLGVMLPDSGHIQEREAEWQSRRRMRGGKREVPPLYTEADAMAVLPALRPVPYGESFAPGPGVSAAFLDAGHILGSAIVTVTVADGGKEKQLVFSGDLGHRGLPIVRDPVPVRRADALVIESTYGNRVHKGMEDTVEEFVRAVDDTLHRKKGNVVIPSFAVGRAQDILYLLTDLTRKGRLSGITLYIDSPLAAEATRITLRHPECYDDETREVFAWRDAHPDAMEVVLVRNMEESRALNSLRGGAILMAGSGMCTAGRIKHHLKHNLWRKECSVIIVGFQAQGTLGRKIVDGAKRVRVFGEEIAVAADVYTIGGLSAHADRDDLLAWAGRFQAPPGDVFVAHGEESVSLEFAGTLKEKLGWLAQVPSPGQPLVLR
ncbi:MAG: MBL fold hydrolase [Deltaproteobacteria bacterium CG_4_9_14_3_um_filter_65_9]|nr:MAG: MBL fold hydrolase [Deltaproteobacteria bacterium CG_4_9_14_3_um_filter_65_9]